MKHIASTALALTACVAAGEPSVFRIAYHAEDSPRDQRIYIKYRNDTGRDICLYPTNWPGRDGKIDSGKGRVFLESSNKVYTTEDFDAGYCPKCVLKVRPRTEIVGFFNYQDFGLPAPDYLKAKVLKFSPEASFCSSK
jgi:hypothetical protein